jgi:hypothetical protein
VAPRPLQLRKLVESARSKQQWLHVLATMLRHVVVPQQQLVVGLPLRVRVVRLRRQAGVVPLRCRLRTVPCVDTPRQKGLGSCIDMFLVLLADPRDNCLAFRLFSFVFQE